MFCGGEGDANAVNTGADTSVGDPSTSEGDAGAVSGDGGADTSAGTQNTDDQPPFHEHPRWKEVLAERDKYKGEIDEMQQKYGGYDVYAQFDQLLAQKPELFEAVKTVMEQHLASGQTDDPVASLQQELQAQKKTVQDLKFERVRDSYQDQFDALAKDIPQGQRPLLERLTEVEMWRRNNAPYSTYDKKLLDSAYKEAEKQLKTALAEEKGRYINDKASDEPPVTGGSQGSARREERPKTREGRAALIAAAMKGAK